MDQLTIFFRYEKQHLICFNINEMVSVSSIFYFLKALEAVIGGVL